jgi:AAHS family 4-hydroxybenzoate transporter-like MFS transporter
MLLIAGTALAIILDGMDNQLLGNVIPALMKEWSLPRAAFTTVLALGPAGMIFGGWIGGMLGDRFGRRTALLGSVLAFAVLTIAIAFVNSVFALGVLRFIAGIGLGGAMPNAAALASEYVPKRHRPFAVTLTIVCIPFGGTVAALLAGQVVPANGWRTLFVVGGVIPIAIALVLFALLPESPHYLAMKRDPTARKASLGDLFAPEWRRDTVGLCAAFFFCLLAIYVGFSWIVAMLTGAGFTQVDGSSALAAFNFGGVGGALIGALVIQRFGSRSTLLGMSALAVASSLAMTTMPLHPPIAVGVVAMFAITGGLLNAVQTTMYALAAHVYPTAIRGTGVGTAVAVGRVGNVAASYVGAFALDAGGTAAFFSTWAIAMTVVCGSLALVRRHIHVAGTPAQV